MSNQTKLQSTNRNHPQQTEYLAVTSYGHILYRGPEHTRAKKIANIYRNQYSSSTVTVFKSTHL